MEGEDREAASFVRHPQMRAVLDYYRSLPRAGSVPAFRDFDPFRFKHCMASMYVWEREPDRRDFTLRLIGEDVRARFRAFRRGMRLDEFFGGEIAARVRQNYLRCIEEPAIMINSGAVYARIGSRRRGERLCLPLADARRNVTLVLGVTLLDKHDAPGDRTEGVGVEPFDVRFFSMSAAGQ